MTIFLTKNDLPIDVLRELERIEAIPENARDDKDKAFYSARSAHVHTDRTVLHNDKIEILKEQEENSVITLQELFSLPYYDDIRVPLTAVQKAGIKDPDFIKCLDDGVGSTGVYAHGFDSVSEEEVFFMVQLPHDYIEGSDIYPHIHWGAGVTSGDVVFGLEYSWCNYGDVAGNTNIIEATATVADVAKTHSVAVLPTLSGTGKKISSVLVCRLFRKAGDVADTMVGDALVLEIDFHYKKTIRGSITEYTKE
jgi:hypothetical protein